MSLDDLALPLRIEQIGVAFGRILALYQVAVVADGFDPAARGCVHSIGVDVIRRKVLRNILGHVRRKPVPGLPVKIVRGVGAVGDVNRIDAASLLLGDALENPLRAGALDADGDAGIFGFECPGQPFPDVQFQRTIIRELALLAGGFDQGRRHARRRRCSRPGRLGEQHSGCKRCRGLEHVAP